MPSIAATPKSEMKPIAAETLKLRSATKSPRMPPHTANGIPESASKLPHGIEETVEQHQDQQQAQRHDERQAFLCFHQRAELARPLDAVALRHRHFLGDAPLRLGDRGAEIAPAYAVFDGHEALIVLPIDVSRARLELHLAKIAK